MEIGDRVLIRKPRNVNQFPQWIEGMDAFDGKEGIIVRIDNPAVILDSTDIYTFRMDWLTVIHNPKVKELSWR